MFVASGSEQRTLEDEVVELLKEKCLKVTFAESCTGGLLAGRLVNVSGASQVFEEGFITYSNEVKERRIGVSADTLCTYGAVSKETAYEMALGAAKTAKADVGVSTTGIAGPCGGTKEKPVGLVYIGCSIKGTTKTKVFHFTGNRHDNRECTVIEALTFLKECLLKWQ